MSDFGFYDEDGVISLGETQSRLAVHHLPPELR
jgi:hypothetical protein